MTRTEYFSPVQYEMWNILHSYISLDDKVGTGLYIRITSNTFNTEHIPVFSVTVRSTWDAIQVAQWISSWHSSRLLLPHLLLTYTNFDANFAFLGKSFWPHNHDYWCGHVPPSHEMRKIRPKHECHMRGRKLSSVNKTWGQFFDPRNDQKMRGINFMARWYVPIWCASNP